MKHIFLGKAGSHSYGTNTALRKKLNINLATDLILKIQDMVW